MTEAKAGSYVGWTVAAMNFRRLMKQRAVAPVSLLLVGESGTDRREMAEAWRQASGTSDLPIIDLDCEPAEIPERCIAITTRPIQSRHADQRPIDLNTRVAVADYKLNGESIPESTLSRFAIKAYVPPLRQRRMDMLALTLWYASQLSVGNRSIHIHSQLIYRMFLDAAWTTNERGLADFLVLAFTAAMKRKGGIVMQDGDLNLWNPSGPDELFIHTNQLLPMIRPGGQNRSLGSPPNLWTCDDVEIPIDRLPMVAIAILFYRFWMSLDEADDDGIPRYILGNDSRWISDSGFDDCGVATLAVTPASELFQEWNWGLGFDKEVIEKMLQFQCYGSTLESLQDGFLEIARPQAQADVSHNSKPVRKRTRKLTDEQFEDYLKVITLKQARRMTFPEIAVDMGLKSRQAAQQLYKRAIKAMQNHNTENTS